VCSFIIISQLKEKEFLKMNMVYTQFIDGVLTTSSNRESWINYNPANNNPFAAAPTGY